MADKPTNRERLQEITAGIEQGIKELFESEKVYAIPVRHVQVPPLFRQQHHAHLYAAPGCHAGRWLSEMENQFERHVKG